MENIRLTSITVKPNAGLNNTLALMNLLENLSLQNQDFITFCYRNFYSECTGCIPGKIWNYIKNNFTYLPDESTLHLNGNIFSESGFDERITAPYVLLETKKGDCDDFALFAKTCIDIVGGYYSNYILFGKNKNQFTHIATFVHRGMVGNKFRDPVVIDGANNNFNLVDTSKYKFYKII